MTDSTGFLCCIPLEKSEWQDRFAHVELGDFVRANTEEKAKNDPDAAWDVFSAEVSFIHRKFDAFAQLGLEVVLHATSADIQQAASRFENVVVIAHWKHERVFKSDIRSPESLWNWMRLADPALQRAGPSLLDPMLSDRLQKLLDDLVVSGGSSLTDFPVGDEGSLAGRVLRREALNKIPHSLLAPGNRVETWDAMLTANQFSDLFGQTFEGTAVMAICHSVLLAEAFRLRHPTAICVCNKEIANAGINLAKLDAALALSRKHRIPLALALSRAADMIDSLGKRR
jgi:hypothetical protein